MNMNTFHVLFYMNLRYGYSIKKWGGEFSFFEKVGIPIVKINIYQRFKYQNSRRHSHFVME